MDKLKKHIQDNLHKLDIDNPPRKAWDTIREQLGGTYSADALKDHIEQHAGELEIETPDPGAWSRVEKAGIYRRRASIRINRVWLYAAACILLLIAIAVFFNGSRPGANKNNELVKTQPVTSPVILQQPGDSVKKEVALAPSPRDVVPAKTERVLKTNKIRRTDRPKVPEALLQIQSGYGSLIASQVKSIQKMPVYGEAAVYFEDFVADFKRLDQQEKQLRKTVMQDGLQEDSLDELALIYQQKLTILKMLQKEIDKTVSRKWNVSDTIPTYIKL